MSTGCLRASGNHRISPERGPQRQLTCILFPDAAANLTFASSHSPGQ